MSTSYRIDQLHLITYKNQRKKVIRDIRYRYLAKSQIVNCNAQNKKVSYANFRGSHLKKVSFDSSEFFGCDFWGTSFNNYSFKIQKSLTAYLCLAGLKTAILKVRRLIIQQ